MDLVTISWQIFRKHGEREPKGLTWYHARWVLDLVLLGI